MKINWSYFITYLFFVLILAIGIGSLKHNHDLSIGLIIFGSGGLIYFFINTIVQYLDGESNKDNNN